MKTQKFLTDTDFIYLTSLLADGEIKVLNDYSFEYKNKIFKIYQRSDEYRNAKLWHTMVQLGDCGNDKYFNLTYEQYATLKNLLREHLKPNTQTFTDYLKSL